MSRTVSRGCLALLLFCGIHAAAASFALLLGRFPSSQLLWLLYFDITRPFSFVPQTGSFVGQSDHASLLVFFVAISTAVIIAAWFRVKTILLGVFAAAWLLSMINLACYFLSCVTGRTSLELSPPALKLTLIAIMGYCFYKAIRELTARDDRPEMLRQSNVRRLRFWNSVPGRAMIQRATEA